MLKIIFWVLFAHWVADFILQPQKIASQKYNSLYVLSKHILIYSSSMYLMLLLFNITTNSELFNFVMINGCLHFVVDFFTSKATHYLYSKNRIHDFFVVIGLDQLLHNLCLLITLGYFRII